MNNIKQFLADYFIINGNYTISDEGVVDVVGNLKLIYEKFNQDGLTEIPIQFGHVKGNFDLEKSNITTLKGFPHTIDYFCSINFCEKLKFLDILFKCKNFYCTGCKKLESLDGLNCKEFIGGNLNLEKIGTNFYAKAFKFNNFPIPTADEMRRFIQLNPKFITYQQAPWISLIDDYSYHKDLLITAVKFEKLYNEPFTKPDQINQIKLFTHESFSL